MERFIKVVGILLAVLSVAILSSFIIFSNLQAIFPPLKEDAAEIFVWEVIPQTLAEFYDDVGRYPTTEEGLEALVTPPLNTENRWKGPYFTGGRVPLDPWGQAYRYRYPGRHNPDSYDVFSKGTPETGEIGNWEREGMEKGGPLRASSKTVQTQTSVYYIGD